MANPAAKNPSVHEAFLAAPAHVVAEILNGELHTHPRPGPRHATAAGVLAGLLMGPFHHGRGGGPGGWRILPEPELHLHDDIIVPDVAGWRRERMPILPKGAAFELSPDWICEVLSPSTAKVDRAKKLPIYAREGVAYAWLVDPVQRTLEVLALDREHWGVLGTWTDDAKVRVRPFDELEIDLADLWDE